MVSRKYRMTIKINAIAQDKCSHEQRASSYPEEADEQHVNAANTLRLENALKMMITSNIAGARD